MAEILMKHGDRRELAKKFDVSHVTIISALKFRTHSKVEKPRDFDPFGQAGLSPLATI